MIQREPEDTKSVLEPHSEHWNRSRRLLYAPSTKDLVYVQLTSVRGDPAAGAPFNRRLVGTGRFRISNGSWTEFPMTGKAIGSKPSV